MAQVTCTAQRKWLASSRRTGFFRQHVLSCPSRHSAASRPCVNKSASFADVSRPNNSRRLLQSFQTSRFSNRRNVHSSSLFKSERKSSPPVNAAADTAKAATPGEFAADDLASASSPAAAPEAEEEILIGKKGRNRITCIKCDTVEDILQAPEIFRQVPHIAVVGRANVGKSSLINHVLQIPNSKVMAKTSSAAGKTTSVNMMLVNDAFVLTDLPGYPSNFNSVGQSLQVDRRWRMKWQDLVHAYLKMGTQGEVDFRALLLLFNIEWRVTPPDQEFLSQLIDHQIPHMLVMTKDDKVEGHQDRTRKADQIRRRLDWEGPHIHYRTDSTDRHSRSARRALQRYIRSFVNASDREEVYDLILMAWSSRKDKVASKSVPIPEQDFESEEDSFGTGNRSQEL